MNSSILYLSGCFNKTSELLSLSIESFISVFIYHYCELPLEVRLLSSEEEFYPCTAPVDLYYRILSKPCDLTVNTSQDTTFLLPAIVSEGGKTIIAGLCAVLRWAIKMNLVLIPDHYSQNLLGFRGGCLVACTESSIWTKFCELQLPSSVKEVALKIRSGVSLTEIPENLVLLEAHLKRPVRTHNILKRKLDIAKNVKQKGSTDVLELDTNFTLYDQNDIPIDKNDIQERLQNMAITEKSEEFCLDHSYLEGIDLTLADMIVFPCVHYLLNNLPSEALNHLENVNKWYARMCSNTLIVEAAKKCGIILNRTENIGKEENIQISVPNIDQISLYKRDPSHTRLKCKHQNPQAIISLLLNSDIHPKYNASYCTKLDWDSLPLMLHPATGDLPKKRVDRKCQQLESIVTAVLKIAKDNQTIVEFCAGGGHVGLLLAYYLPRCKILLIENKESSMMRAKQRASKLSLDNVFFYQCNLDYFKGSFDLGVSLHACGVATDLVIQQCIKKQASFVCCPCCYGSIQDTHLLTYPLSKKFKSTNLSKKDYTLLAHFADRNEVNTPTAEQGEVCMGLIDTDRVYYAEEQGYKTDLTTLQPVTCSPKHNLLIGISPLQINS